MKTTDYIVIGAIIVLLYSGGSDLLNQPPAAVEVPDTEPSTITVRATDKDGLPLEGLWVYVNPSGLSAGVSGCEDPYLNPILCQVKDVTDSNGIADFDRRKVFNSGYVFSIGFTQVATGKREYKTYTPLPGQSYVETYVLTFGEPDVPIEEPGDKYCPRGYIYIESVFRCGDRLTLEDCEADGGSFVGTVGEVGWCYKMPSDDFQYTPSDGVVRPMCLMDIYPDESCSQFNSGYKRYQLYSGNEQKKTCMTAPGWEFGDCNDTWEQAADICTHIPEYFIEESCKSGYEPVGDVRCVGPPKGIYYCDAGYSFYSEVKQCGRKVPSKKVCELELGEFENSTEYQMMCWKPPRTVQEDCPEGSTWSYADGGCVKEADLIWGSCDPEDTVKYVNGVKTCEKPPDVVQKPTQIICDNPVGTYNQSTGFCEYHPPGIVIPGQPRCERGTYVPGATPEEDICIYRPDEVVEGTGLSVEEILVLVAVIILAAYIIGRKSKS